MRLKQQSAIEFIMTYSLSLLIIGLFVVAVLVLSDSKPPVAYLGSTCNIQPLFPCASELGAGTTVSLVLAGPAPPAPA